MPAVLLGVTWTVTRRGKIRNSRAAVLREELEARTDDRRIVAELLSVPVEAVELRSNPMI